MKERALVRARSGAVTGFKHALPLSSADHLGGAEIEEVIGFVRGNSIRARHLGYDIMAGLRSVVGGEIKDYTKMMAESREQAIDRMVEQALDIGADAIVGVRLTTSTVMAGAAEILAYGTAVKLKQGEQG